GRFASLRNDDSEPVLGIGVRWIEIENLAINDLSLSQTACGMLVGRGLQFLFVHLKWCDRLMGIMSLSEFCRTVTNLRPKTRSGLAPLVGPTCERANREDRAPTLVGKHRWLPQSALI